MDPFLLPALHVAAGFGAFTALGAICLAERPGKGASILHGVSLVLLLLVGLHLLMSQELLKSGGWWHVKVLLWLLLGAAPALAKRRLVPPPVLLTLLLVLGAFAGWLGLAKPF